MRAHVQIAAIALLLTGLGSGCDFFKELQSLPEAGEDESGDGSGEDGDEESDTGTPTDIADEGPCDVLDDQCSDQDTLLSCDFDSGEVFSCPCASMCAESGMLNFTCTPTADFSHGCWCAQPGQFKLDNCLQLDTCITDCGGGPGDECALECFTRTDAQTVRLLGTLYHCADKTCDAICAESPIDCGNCLLSARAGLYGDCGVEREVCNADLNDEPSWP